LALINLQWHRSFFFGALSVTVVGPRLFAFFFQSHKKITIESINGDKEQEKAFRIT